MRQAWHLCRDASVSTFPTWPRSLVALCPVLHFLFCAGKWSNVKEWRKFRTVLLLGLVRRTAPVFSSRNSPRGLWAVRAWNTSENALKILLLIGVFDVAFYSAGSVCFILIKTVSKEMYFPGQWMLQDVTSERRALHYVEWIHTMLKHETWASLSRFEAIIRRVVVLIHRGSRHIRIHIFLENVAHVYSNTMYYR